jgi:hypothetical protein
VDGRDVPDVPAALTRRASSRRPGTVNAVKKMCGLRKQPDAKRINKIVEAWRPYRSVACWYLWQSLRDYSRTRTRATSLEAGLSPES